MNAPHATLGRGLETPIELSIGSLPLRLHVPDAPLLSAARERYAGFGVDGTEPLSIFIESNAEEKGAVPEFTYEFEGAVLRVFPDRAYFSGVHNEYAMDSLLRIFLSWILPQRSGFLLHAATVVRNGRAYVFTGRSGAGKSTVAALSPAGSVLTDEVSLLRKEDGQWRAYGTPFWGEFRAAGSNTSAPLAGIFRLLQSPENRLKPLRRAETLRALLPNVLFFSAVPEENRRLLELVDNLAAEISGYNLDFRKDATFWEVISA